MLVLTSTVLVLGQVSRNQHIIGREANTTAQLQSARDALLGYALSQQPPGVLPCPDTDGDGDADSTGGACDAVAALLPFRTLGLDRLMDASGTSLWYAVDPIYAVGSAPFNSSRLSNLNVNDTPVAFVLMAPGETLNGQVRPSGNLTPSNFFEGASGDTDTYRYEQQASDDNNDRLLPYFSGAYWALIENSVVLPTAVATLVNYASVCGAYPWAATFNSASLESVNSLQQGGLPVDSSTASNASVCSANLVLPSWFHDHWAAIIQYSMCQNAQGQCLLVTGDESASTAAIVIAPGIAIAGQSRPSSLLSQYFENVNQLTINQFLYRSIKNHDGSVNDVLHYLP